MSDWKTFVKVKKDSLESVSLIDNFKAYKEYRIKGVIKFYHLRLKY